MFRHASLPLIFFPAVITTIYLGGYWPLLYAFVSIIIYLVFDRFPYHSIPAYSALSTKISNVWLLLQIPFTLVLEIMLFASIAPLSPGAEAVNILGLKLQGLHSFGEILSASLVVGFHLSTGFVVAHEMMHRRGKFWKACSRLLLMMNADAHFQEAHIFGHHANVGTPHDPATARRGESLYHFFIRSTLGQWQEAFNYECHRLRNLKTWKQMISNRVLRGNFGSLLLMALIGYFFGLVATLSYLVVVFMAKFLLEAINYIQHYGLVRQKGIRVDPSHSWENGSLASSLILFNLTRHAQHHQQPLRSYEKLEYNALSPQIKGGYMLAILTAFIPPLWFQTMHPLLDDPERIKAS